MKRVYFIAIVLVGILAVGCGPTAEEKVKEE